MEEAEVKVAERPCIIVVDDEPSVLHVLQDMVEEAGFSAIGVRHADRALDEAARCRPCLFLIDITLAARSGIEVAQELRNNGFGGTPMIAISASHIMTRAATHSELFQAVLEKPVDLDVLLGHISEVLGAAGQSTSPQPSP